MASVTSLDKDLRKLRLDKYTPAAANQARLWIEEALGEKLPSSDLLQGLKDGVALCKLVNLGAPSPPIRFKQSAMPFVQMENISHFLRACQAPPFNLHQHDMFLTVDLYEQKDPAQVLQCLGAFSRAAHDANPGRFPDPIGPKNRGGAGGLSPQASGYSSPSNGHRNRGASVNSNASSAANAPNPHAGDKTPSGRSSPIKSPLAVPSSPGPVSSWSKREHEGSTAPAWNIAQYGYMGGASQGNLGISFGGMRQITAAGPKVPSLADKERRRKEEADRRAEEERQRKARLEADEEAARQEEERRWEEETQKLRQEEKRKGEDEKRRWEEQERRWKTAEEQRRREEQEAEARLAEERRMGSGGRGDGRLRGQFLSQYQAEQAGKTGAADRGDSRGRSEEELEKEIKQARRREEEYERERQTRNNGRPVSEIAPTKPRSGSPHKILPAAGLRRTRSRYDSWTRNDERDYLQTQWQQQQDEDEEGEGEETREPSSEAPSPPAQPRREVAGDAPDPSPRPLPEPKKAATAGGNADKNRFRAMSGGTARPLPDPAKYSSSPPAQAQAQTRAGGWASKSLLEREMEMERQRQQEWEEAQKETAKAVRSGDGVEGIGGGIGGRWDVGQWSGYTGGDSQNRGAQGIGSGRRQIVGPRPLPSSDR